MTTISAGVVTGLSGHLDLFKSRRPEFLSYLGQQPSGTALGNYQQQFDTKACLTRFKRCLLAGDFRLCRSDHRL
jgi:hypothetical protein